jgi:hypothetical protein
VPARPLLVLALLVPTLATAGMAQTRCAIYFGLEQTDARLTKLVGNRPQMLKADVVSPWPEGVDTTTEVGAVTVVKGVPSTSTLPSIVGAIPPTTLTLQSWPLPKKEIENLESWFSKKGAKQYPGLCLDSERATYILEIGMAVNAPPAGNCPEPTFGPGQNGREGWATPICSFQTTSVFLFPKVTGGETATTHAQKPESYYFVLSEWSNNTSHEVKSPGELSFYTLRPTLNAMLKHLSALQKLP